MAIQPPDGGWGWVVVVSSLICHVLIDGIGLAYGVLLPKFVHYFNEPISKVSLMGSVLIGTYMCTGPIASGLVNKFGCRVVCIAGSIISALGFILASFSPNLNVLILTYGVIGGLGFGMVYLPAIVSVGEYFEKKRPFATGIAVCGSGIGTFIFSPLINYLSETYDWRSMLIITAGILLHGVVCGMLFRPLNNKTSLCVCSEYTIKAVDENEGHVSIKSEEIKPFIQLHEVSNDTNEKSDETMKCKLTKCYLDDQTEFMVKGKHESGGRMDDKPSIIKSSVNLNTYSSKYSRYEEMSKHRFILNRMNDIFDCSLYCNMPFVLIFIGNVFAAAAYYIAFLFLVDNALMIGIRSSAAAWLLSTIGIMNIVGRILAGALATLKKVNSLLLNNIALLLASMTLLLLPVLTSYTELLIFCILYGLSVATYVSLTSIILCDILGVDRLASAFGHLGLARGISTVIGPFLAGAIYDTTGNYHASFYFGGSMFFVAAVFHFIIMLPCLKKYIK